MFEERVDLSNDMTWRQMIAVGVRRVVLARGELDKLEGPKLPRGGQSCAGRREKPREQGIGRRRRRRSDEADESDATEEEAAGGRTTRVGRPRGGMKVAARIGEGLRREIERGRRPRVRDLGWATASTNHTPLLKIPVWWRRAVLPSLPWVVCFLSFFLGKNHAIEFQALRATCPRFSSTARWDVTYTAKPFL